MSQGYAAPQAGGAPAGERCHVQSAAATENDRPVNPCPRPVHSLSPNDLLPDAGFRALVQSTPDIIFTLDCDQRFTGVFGKVIERAGFMREHFIGRTARELFGDSRAGVHEQANARALAGDTLMYEWSAPDVTGTMREYQTSVAPMVDEHGAVIGIVGISRDITELRHAESARHASEHRYRMLFESNPLPNFIWDVETLRFVDVNQAAIDAYGWSREAFLGRLLVTDIRPATEREKFVEQIHDIREGTAWRGVFVHQRKDGSIFDADVTAHPLDLEGRSLRVATVRDVTAERRAYAARAQLAAIVSGSNEGIIGQDLEGRVTQWNPAAEQIYGWRAQEVIGRALPEVVPPEHREEFERGRRRVIEQGESYRADVVRRRKDGRDVEISLSMAPVRDELGRITGIAAIVRDITQQKLLERQLRQAQKMEAVGRLAGGVAHDFNNMLTVIKAHTELLRTELPADAAAQEGLDEIFRAAQRAAVLTRQLLAFSRQQVLEARVVDLNEVVRGVHRMLTGLIDGDIELSMQLQPSPAPILADPGQLEQVLVNLALNAQDAMPDGGELTIATNTIEIDDGQAKRDPPAAPGSYVVLSVRDTGTGMDEATRAHLFEPFFTTKERAKGTGLGLPMVLGTVEQSGGFVTVDTSPGRGTTFAIHLPLASVPTAAPRTAERVGQEPDSDETVLLVEDDEAVRSITRTMLRRRGYSVLEAPNGREALDLLARVDWRVDLVITDAVMPEMNGPELARAVELHAPQLPVLHMSGYTDDDVLRAGRLGPLEAFLPKPFTSQQLYDFVEELIARGRQARV